VAGLAAAFGSGAMTNPIGDIEKANVILITGSNTTENHPVLSSYVKRAVTQKGASSSWWIPGGSLSWTSQRCG
jgi:predicted molibdopterin-dependent oxidoreductase YjgC